MRIFTLLLLTLVLTACAGTSKRPVDILAPADATFLASDVATYISGELPAASTTLSIAAASLDDVTRSETLPTAVARALRDLGFAVFDGSDQGSTGHRLRPSVDAFDAGYILRLEFDDSLITRLYSRTATGQLEPASAFAKRSRQ